MLRFLLTLAVALSLVGTILSIPTPTYAATTCTGVFSDTNGTFIQGSKMTFYFNNPAGNTFVPFDPTVPNSGPVSNYSISTTTGQYSFSVLDFGTFGSSQLARIVFHTDAYPPDKVVDYKTGGNNQCPGDVKLGLATGTTGYLCDATTNQCRAIQAGETARYTDSSCSNACGKWSIQSGLCLPYPNGPFASKTDCNNQIAAAGTPTISTVPPPPPPAANVCDPTTNKDANNQACTSSAGTTCSPGSGNDPSRPSNPDDQGVQTALGCIPTNPSALIQALLKFALGAGGGIALLLMAFGSIEMITSQGNHETLKEGQGRFTSAAVGLLFVIFSVLLLRIIGVDILNIPGFG